MKRQIQLRMLWRSLRKAGAFVPSAAVIALVALVGTGYAGLGGGLETKRSTSKSSLRSITQETRSREQVTMETVILRPSGFDPAAMSRPAGRFVLSVENYTGLDEVSLRFSREAGARIHEVPLFRGQYEWNELVDLPPGRYALTEATHPDWICWITITRP